MNRSLILAVVAVISLVFNSVRGSTAQQLQNDSSQSGAKKSDERTSDIRKEQRATQRTETVVIPLTQIWGNVSSESKQLRSLEPEFFVYRDTPEKIAKYNNLSAKELEAIAKKANDSFTLPVERAMQALALTNQQKPQAGFAVEGNGREALNGVFDVLVKKQMANEEFSTRKEVSAVFLSYVAQPAVAFERVERTENRVKIHYMLVPRATLDAHWHLAIIPLGRLPAGKYRVELIRSANETKLNPQGYPPVPKNAEQRIICQPFQFVVKENP